MTGETDKRWTLHHGDCLAWLRTLPNESVDALITDPPYSSGGAYRGDRVSSTDDKYTRTQWVAWLASVMAECLRVLKPGGHALVWSLPRTEHWTACAVEDAGFEIRDGVYHLCAQGWPKSLDVSKAIDAAAGAEARGRWAYKSTRSRLQSLDLAWRAAVCTRVAASLDERRRAMRRQTRLAPPQRPTTRSVGRATGPRSSQRSSGGFSPASRSTERSQRTSSLTASARSTSMGAG
jgi:hypothetical protein